MKARNCTVRNRKVYKEFTHQIYDNYLNISTGDILIKQKDAAIENILRSVRLIKEDFNKLKEKIEELIEKKIDSDIFTDTEINKDIQSLMKEIDSKIKFIPKKIKKIANDILKPHTNKTELKIVKTQYLAISHSFQKVMSNYSNSLISLKDKHKKRIKRQLEIVHRNTTEEKLDNLVLEQNLSIFSPDITQDMEVAMFELT